MKNLFFKVTIVSFSTLAFILVGSTGSFAIKIQNGVNCVKPNTTVKIGEKVYRCTKNPIVKPNRNTWTLATCITTHRLWRNSKQELADWQNILRNPDEKTNAALKDLEGLISELESTMKNDVCRKGA